jgi:hypothetical protein
MYNVGSEKGSSLKYWNMPDFFNFKDSYLYTFI